MTLLEKRISEMETRPVGFDSVEHARLTAVFTEFSAINKFEGIESTDIDKRLFDLFATGKISKREYLDLCKSDALGAAG